MSQSLPLNSVAQATGRFVAGLGPAQPRRVEAKVSSCDGMPLLCAVEAVLGEALASPTTQELVWLNGAPAPGAHVLQLQAFGPAGELLAEARHEFAG